MGSLPKTSLNTLSFWSPDLAILFLKLGIAFIYVYAALAMSLDPASFEHWLPSFLANASLIPAETLIHLFGIYELGLVLWILSGKGLFYASAVSLATLFFIVIFNLDSFNVLFRNVAIMFASLALAVLSRRRSRDASWSPQVWTMPPTMRGPGRRAAGRNRLASRAGRAWRRRPDPGQRPDLES